MNPTLKRAVSAVFVLIAATALLIWPMAAAEGAQQGIGYCANILIPSLFPFMVLSTYLVKSGMSHSIGKALGPVTRVLFHLPGCTGATIFMSMIGGFPVGARGIAALHEQGEISDSEAGRMLCFCVNAGPAFVISVVGAGLMRSITAGVILFAAQILASVILGFFLGVSAGNEKHNTSNKGPKACPSPFILSAADAARGMMSMCVFVVLFAVLAGLLRQSGAAQALCGALLRLNLPPAFCGSLLSVLLEVTGGCYDVANLGAGYGMFAFALGWGGLCVQFQVLSCLTKISFSRPKFFFFQFLHGVLAAAITTTLFQIFPQAAETFSTVTEPLTGSLSTTAPAAAALILLCAVLLCSIGRDHVSSQKKCNS